MKIYKLLAVGFFIGFLVSPLYAYDVNKDLKNLGPAAYDLAVVLSGSETVTGHFDGYTSGRFASFANGPSGLNHLLHWQHFWDGSDNRIDNGQIIHVGWTTADHSSSVLDMYWTDQCGERIPGSVVYNITSGWTYETQGEGCFATWNHDFMYDETVMISNIQFAVSPERYELSDLNGQNPILRESLRPLHDGYVTLCQGQSLTLPVPNSDGMSVVLVYDVSSERSAARARDFVQFQCFPDSIIPTPVPPSASQRQ